MAGSGTTIRSEAKTELQLVLTDSSKSAVEKYRETVIGREGLWPLIRHELITGLLGDLPGALGFYMRKLFYPGILGHCGKGVVFGRHMALRHTHKIFAGDGCVFDDGVVLDAKGRDNAGIRLGSSVMIGRSTILGCKGGSIEIGKNSNLGLNCIVHSESFVRIGENVLVAGQSYILGGGMHGIGRIDLPIIQQSSTTKGVAIEDNVWIGAGVIILDGVTVAKDSVVGAGSVVTADIPPFTIAAGVPARVIRERA